MTDILKLHAQIDDLLHDLPSEIRMKASADILTVLLRARKEMERAIREQEAAELLPKGATEAAEKLHCHRSTVYRMASRQKIVARQSGERDAA